MTSWSVVDASLSFGDITALDGVSVDYPPGEVVAVVGGDGAGKTTLLRVVAGELEPGSGTVTSPPSEQIGYMPATAGSWAELTVAENMQFVGEVYGLAGEILRSRTESLLERAGLSRARDRLARNLSGGMRRKLGFCLAMVHDPPLLVLDEPSTGIDPVSRVDLWRLISEAAAGGAAVLMTTTYLDEAERAGHIVVMDRGRVILSGAPQDVIADFRGTVTSAARPQHVERSWRRGRAFHEIWPDAAAAPPGADVVRPDLADVVIATSLAGRRGREEASS